MATLGRLRVTKAGILFIVGVLLLGALTTGAIILVKNRGEAVRRDQAIQIAEQNLKDQSEVATDTKTDEETDKTPQPEATDTAADTADDAGTVAATTPAETELPQTGPNDASSIAIVAILALSAAFYVASRRAARQS